MMRGLSRIVACLVVLWPAAAGADPGCASCHATRVEARLRRPVSAATDAHGRAGVGCADCHGGDPDQATARAHDLGRGFVGRPEATGAVGLCESCHDGTTEAPDVAGTYHAGAHWDAIAAGRFAAGCASCHRVHDVEPLDPDRAQARCISCHADPERMEASGLPTDQLAQWSASVHGQRAASGHGDAPRCPDCHAPHRNQAGLAAVGACGTCHGDVREAFESGPHAEAFERLGFLDCVECHGSHEVTRPGGRMLSGLGAVCARCHGPGQPAFETVEALAGFADAIDRVRAIAPRDDPRRRAVLRAVHALDPQGLEGAVEDVDLPARAPPPPAPPAVRRAHRPPAWPGIVAALGVVALGLLGVYLWSRWRRR